jgi:hypothetical protein
MNNVKGFTSCLGRVKESSFCQEVIARHICHVHSFGPYTLVVVNKLTGNDKTNSVLLYIFCETKTNSLRPKQ